jgi:hypothetical protein
VRKCRSTKSSWKNVKTYISVILKASSLIFFLFGRTKSELQKAILIKIFDYSNASEKKPKM